jgi:nucleoid-associated protein Lsr2
MARTVQIHLLDDIDGTSADETVKFSLDGTLYEIDLNAEHSEQFRKTIARYIVAGRRSSLGIVTGTRTGRRALGAVHFDRAQNQAIRQWAKRSGIEINDRGRIPASVVERFERDAGN